MPLAVRPHLPLRVRELLERGAAVCGNGMMADMPVTDRRISDLLRTEMLQPRIVGRAVDLALAQVQREQGDGSRVAIASSGRSHASTGNSPIWRRRRRAGGAVPVILAAG